MKSESEFTRPRPDCPHPEWWTAVNDSATENEVALLVAAFVRALQPELVLETGTARGHTARVIGEALVANGHGRLITLETSPVRCLEARVRCTDLPVEVIEASSMEWEPQGLQFDFAWFDSAAHGRDREFLRFFPWLRTGGIVGFHDTGPHHPVRPGIEELDDRGLLRPIFLPTPRGVAFCEVLCYQPEK